MFAEKKKRNTAKIIINNQLITIAKKGLRVKFKYSSLDFLHINTEIDETARELEVSMKKLQIAEPELNDLLRMNLRVKGISFSLVVLRTEGEPLAVYAQNEMRQILRSSTPVKGSLADDVIQDALKNDDPNDVVYPIYFHKCL